MPDQTLAQRIKTKYPGEYDDIPDAELETKVKAKYPGEYDDLPMTQAAAPKSEGLGVLDQLGEAFGAAKDLVVGSASTAGHAANAAFGHPEAFIEDLKGLINAHKQQAVQSGEAFKASANPNQPIIPRIGQALLGVEHGLAAVTPVTGPVAAGIAEDTSTGHYGRAAVNAAAVFAPEAVRRFKPSVSVPGPFKNPNVAEQEAVAFGQREGIPIDAGTATGSPIVRGTQQLLDKGTVGGGIIGRQAVKAQEAALTSTGERLSNRVNPSPVTNVEAGQAVTQAFTDAVSKLHQDANQAYGDLRSIENDPKNLKTITTGTKTENTGVLNAQGKPITRTVNVTEDIPLPVDLRSAKTALQPVLDRMKRQMPVTQQQASTGLRALENLVNGPDYASASTVDADLSAIKGIAREASSPDLRNRSQGLAAQSITQLEKQVQAAVARGGPKALQALQRGRAATAQKYTVADTLNALNDEPGRVYSQALGTKDSNLARLREINRVAPQVMPKLGRAYLEDLLNTATSEGGFDRAQGLWSKWQNLGPGTKQLIFKNPALVADLNNFFLLAKKIATNPNPSGTGYVTSLGAQGGMLIWQPHIAVPVELSTAVVSKLLHSQAGVKALTQGMRIGVGNKTAAALAAANILRLAQQPEAEPQTPDMPETIASTRVK